MATTAAAAAAAAVALDLHSLCIHTIHRLPKLHAWHMTFLYGFLLCRRIIMRPSEAPHYTSCPPVRPSVVLLSHKISEAWWPIRLTSRPWNSLFGFLNHNIAKRRKSRPRHSGRRLYATVRLYYYNTAESALYRVASHISTDLHRPKTTYFYHFWGR